MRSEEQNPDRSAVVCGTPTGSLDFVRNGAYLEPSQQKSNGYEIYLNKWPIIQIVAEPRQS